MKSKSKRVISLILSFVFVLSISILPVNAETLIDNDRHIVVCAEEVKNEYINSVNVVEQTADQEYERRNYESTMSFNQITEHIDMHDDELRSHFSGAQINDEGYLVVALCCNIDFCKKYIIEELNCENIVFEKGTGSYYYGQQQLDAINEKIALLQEKKVSGKNISAEAKEMMESHPCTKYNYEDNTITVVFAVSEEAERAIAKAKIDKNGSLAYNSKAQLSDVEALEVEKFNKTVDTFRSIVSDQSNISYSTDSKSEWLIEEQAATEPWRPGRWLWVYNDPNANMGASISTGYRAKYTYNGTTYYGFVTCAHGTNTGNSVYIKNSISSDYKLGVILDRSYGKKVDVSFLRITNSNYTNSNAIYYTSSQAGVTRQGTVLDGTQTTVARNTQIYKSGKATYLTSGYVKSLNHSGYVDDTYFYSLIKADRSMVASGDSGAVTYIVDTGATNGKAVGIVFGISNDKAIFIKASNIKAVFGAEAY